MGLNSIIRLWNVDAHLTSMERDYRRLEDIDDRIDGDLPDGLDFYHGTVLQPVHELLEGLEEPPAVNDLDELVRLAKEGPMFSGKRETVSYERFQLSGSKSNWAMKRMVPEFLDERSKRAGTLWRKFTGVSDQRYRLELLGDEYLFDSRSVGLLRSPELSELGGELRGLLDETDACYRRIDETYPERTIPAREVRVVEFIRALCYLHSSGEVLTYRVST